MLKRLRRPRSIEVVLFVSAITSLVLVLSPLFGLHGVESALVLGLVLPPFVAGHGARVAISAREKGAHGGALAWRACRDALLALAVPLVVLALGALRQAWCSPLEGLAFFALGPVVGVLLAALTGVLVGAAIARPRLATILAALVPVTTIGLGLSRFVTTPAIFAFAHYVGYFPGTLYDADVAIEPRYLTFRALSLALGAGLALACVALVDPASARLSLRRARTEPVVAAFALVMALLASIGEAYGCELGHRSSAAWIEERLGRRMDGAHCSAIVPRELPRERAERVLEDCEFRVAQAADVLGIRPPERIVAFFFRSTDEKRELMGASSTYIAKPWRREVYLQLDEWPHPVLFHEIVHAVAADIGTGPFRISGGLGGVIPSPGIVEGLAVAIAWDERDGMTPHQWARAMLETGHEISIADTEGLGFLLQPASRAYTANGSFVRWILETRGASAVRRLYMTSDYQSALGMPVADAEREWRAFLQTVELPPEGLALAELRFRRGAIFSQVCPHAVAALMSELGGALASGDDEGALETCARILAIDHGDAVTRARRAALLARAGSIEEAEAELASLEGASPPILALARTGIADALWQRGERARAAAMYRALLGEPAGEDDRRQLEVKLLGAEGDAETDAALRELLAPRGASTHDAATTISAIGRLRAARTDGLADYLEARQLAGRERFELAAPMIARARALGLPTPRVTREARRVDAIARYGAGDRQGSRALWDEIVADPTSSEAMRVEARDWLQRIAWRSTAHAPR